MATSCLLAAAVAACGDADGPGGSSSATTSAGGAGGTNAAMFRFSVQVESIPANRLEPTGPAAGAEVLVRLEDGAQLVSATDDDGVAAFAIADGSQHQRCDIIVHKAEHGFMALADQTVAEVALTVWLSGPAVEDVELHGTASGTLDPEHYLIVSNTGSPGVQEGPSETWSLKVPPQRAMTLVGLEFEPHGDPSVSQRGIENEFFAWRVLEVPPLTTDTELDLDFSRPTAAEAFSGSFPVPSGGGLLSQVGTGYVQVSSGESARSRSAFCGAATRIDISDDGSRFEYVGEAVPTGYPASTLYLVTAGQAASYVRVEGYPSNGPQPFVPLEPPLIVSPLTDLLPWGSTVTWSLDGELPDLYATLVMVNDDGLVSVISAAQGAVELRWPELPADIDRETYLGASASLSLSEAPPWITSGGAPPIVRSVATRPFTLTEP